jgi:hypothetical protein
MYATIPNSARNHPLAVLLGKSPDSTLLSPVVFDQYTIASMVALVHLSLKSYGGSTLPASSRIAAPDQQAYLDRIRIYDWVGTPEQDTDGSPNSADQVASDLVMCVFDTLREWSFVDKIDSGSNSWDTVLGTSPGHPSLCPNNTQTCTKQRLHNTGW